MLWLGAVALAAAPPRPGIANVTLSWHVTQLDHFNFGDGRTFRQRVFSYTPRNWAPGAPILFYTGNEANVELYVNSTGLMWENAGALSSMLVWAEHRYYGESLPFGAASAANGSTLAWLTMEQALADYATLIHSLKARLRAADSPVVAIGGSYGGMLAAWLRLHYPTAVVGAIAASAPVLAFDGLLGPEGAAAWDSNSYWRVVTADASVEAGSAAGCADGVRASWPALFDMARTERGRAWLGANFALCSPLDEKRGAARLAGWLLNVWDTLAMGNFPYPSNYLIFQQTRDPSVTLPAWPFRAACAAFDGASAHEPAASLLGRMAEAAAVLYNASGQLACNALPADVEYDGIWDYQWCTERLPQETYFSLDGVRDMFWSRPANSSAVREHCASKYGVAAKGDWVAASSGFGDASTGSNIVFSNGQYDPWRSGGVLRNLSTTLVAVDISEGAHHLDLMWSDPRDPRSVRRAREVELAAMRAWIAEATGRTGPAGRAPEGHD